MAWNNHYEHDLASSWKPRKKWNINKPKEAIKHSVARAFIVFIVYVESITVTIDINKNKNNCDNWWSIREEILAKRLAIEFIEVLDELKYFFDIDVARSKEGIIFS